MRTVSETDAKRCFAALLDEAEREPVVIRRQERDVAVLVSAREYERLCATGAADLGRAAPAAAQPAAAGDLTGSDLGDIVADDDGG